MYAESLKQAISVSIHFTDVSIRFYGLLEPDNQIKLTKIEYNSKRV
jgi:hypothetical protein